MLDIIKFCFSSFWIWLGATIWFMIVASAAAAGVEKVRGILSYSVRRG